MMGQGNNLHETVISVIIPAFNEEKTVGSIVKRTYEVLRRIALPYEVIVVDDGSTDKTANAAYSNGAIVISKNRNGGKGRALCLGIEKAKGSILVTIDADGAHRPEEIPRLLYPILKGNPETHVVIGSRFHGYLEKNAMPRLHFIGNRFFSLAIKLLTGRWVTDSQSGFRAYRREVVESLEIESSGFEVETEMTIKVLRKGFSAKEVPITCYRRNGSDSKLNTFRDGFSILKMMLHTSFTNS